MTRRSRRWWAGLVLVGLAGCASSTGGSAAPAPTDPAGTPPAGPSRAADCAASIDEARRPADPGRPVAPGIEPCALVPVGGGRHLRVRVIAAARPGPERRVAWLDLGGPGINADSFAPTSVPPWLGGDDLLVPVERWVDEAPSAACRTALRTHVLATLAGGEPTPWARACGERPATGVDDYAEAVRVAHRTVAGGIRVMVGASFGAVRLGAALPQLGDLRDSRAVLVDPGPPPGTPLAAVAASRGRAVAEVLATVDRCPPEDCEQRLPPALRTAQGRLALLYEAYGADDLTRLLRDARAGGAAGAQRVRTAARQAAFLYGDDQLAPGAVGYWQEMCAMYGRPSEASAGPADVGGLGVDAAVARQFLRLIGSCDGAGRPPAAGIVTPVCVVVNRNDPIARDHEGWTRLVGADRVVTIDGALRHGDAAGRDPGTLCPR